MDISVFPERDGSKLNQGPPRPPRQGQSIMAMNDGGGMASDAVNGSNPAMQIMAKMGTARNALLELAAALPPLSQPIQQILAGLEQVVPQMVADVVSGNPPGFGGAGMGAPQANAAPVAPPVQAGIP